MAFNITDFNNKWANFKEELLHHINHALDKNGDTMNGSLLLSKHPTDNMEATTKEYVDYLWSFIPGDTIIKESTETQINISLGSHPISNMTFPYSIPFLNNSGIDKSTLLICNQPKANGFIRFSGVMKPLLVTDLRYYGGYTFTEYSLSPEYDLKMSYSVKYYREGYDDIVLYETPIFSVYEVVNDINHLGQLGQKQTLNLDLPVSKGVNGYIKLETLIHSTTIHSSLDRWYLGLNTIMPSFGFTISIGNPIFTL